PREPLRDRFAQRLRLEAALRRAHVLEDALLGARRHDRLPAALHEHVRAPLGTAVLLDRHESDDTVRAPVFAVSQEHHAVTLDIHAASGAPPVRAARSGPEGITEPRQHTTDPAHGLRRSKMSLTTTVVVSDGGARVSLSSSSS